MSEPSAPLSFSALFRQVASDFARCWKPLVGYEIAFKVVSAFVAVPASVWLLSLLMTSAGRTAVSNTDILNFLQSPLGILYALLMMVTTLAGLVLEQAGMMAVVALRKSTLQKITIRQGLMIVLTGLERVLRLGGLKLGAL